MPASDEPIAAATAAESVLPAPPPLLLPESSIALFLDLDGTLAPIASRPELVAVPRATIQLVKQLSEHLLGAVAILSGRPLEQIDSLLAPLKLPAAGVHGAQLRRAGDQVEAAVPAEWARAQVAAACESLRLPDGVWLEAKAGLSFAFHFRAAPDHATWVAQQARSIAARTGGAYAVQFGRCIAEVKPANADKGTALLALMQSSAFRGRVPIVLGDDLTDEAAFAEAHHWGGESILVGARSSTVAMHRLESPGAVTAWLSGILDRSRRQPRQAAP